MAEKFWEKHEPLGAMESQGMSEGRSTQICLRVSIGHDSGGNNFFSGGSIRRGCYIFFGEETKIHKNGQHIGWSSCMTLGGDNKNFKMLAKELARKNQKVMESVACAVEAVWPEIARLYKAMDHKGIHRIISESIAAQEEKAAIAKSAGRMKKTPDARISRVSV